MREPGTGTLQALKRKLSFHPLMSKDKKLRSLRHTYSHDSLAVHDVYTEPVHKYPILKLNDNLSLAIGDSFESNPRTAQRSGAGGNGKDDAASLARFEYGPIRTPKKIRLLLILPAHDQDEPLETLLFHADLHEVPFQALSYAWGDPAKTKALRCNGRALTVPQSTHCALLAVRNLGDSRAITIVWADGVCINQTDMEERTTHLKMMSDIYAASVVTTVWLGGGTSGVPGGAACRRVFDTIDMLHQASRCPDFRARLERDELDLASLEHFSLGDSHKTLQIQAENRADLSKFFAHAWFERIWIWQQVVLSRKVFLLFNGRVRPWSYLVDTAWCMHKLHWDSALVPELFSYGERKVMRYTSVLELEELRNGYLYADAASSLSGGSSIDAMSLRSGSSPVRSSSASPTRPSTASPTRSSTASPTRVASMSPVGRASARSTMIASPVSSSGRSSSPRSTTSHSSTGSSMRSSSSDRMSGATSPSSAASTSPTTVSSRRSSRAPIGYGLLELLTSSRNAASSQPLDRVFGLYGLMGDGRELEIVETFFDYTLSPLTLFLNLTINLMLSHETLDVLHLVHNDPVKRPTWPSFVPDLSCVHTGRLIGSRRGRATWEYHAAGDTKPSLRIINGRSCRKEKVPRFEDDVHVALSGVIIDEVCRVGTEMKDSRLNVGLFLADWVNTALMTDGRKFYTMYELNKARNIWLSSHGSENGGSRDRDSSRDRGRETLVGPVPERGRRPSLPSISPADARGRRPSLPNIEHRRPSAPNIHAVSGNSTSNNGQRRPGSSRRPSISPDNTPPMPSMHPLQQQYQQQQAQQKQQREDPQGQKEGKQLHLRNSFAPGLLDAIKKIDIEAAPDSPTLPQPKTPRTPAGGPFNSAAMSTLPTAPYPVGNITSVEAFWRTLIRDRDCKGAAPSASMQKTHFEPWFAAASGPMGAMLEALQPGHWSASSQSAKGSCPVDGRRPVPAFNDWIHKASAGSRIVRTKNGYIGTVPRFVEEGDLVCVLYGGQTPFVLRREAWGNYRFIGDCYIHGMMNGEALEMDLDETEFVLV